MLNHFNKLVAAVAGGLTPTGVVALLAENGVDVPSWLAALLVAVAAPAAVAAAPANGPHPSLVYEDQELITPETNPELYELEDEEEEYVGKHRAPCEECPASDCEDCPLAGCC